MTDRELLELAAKAAGLEIFPHRNAGYSNTLLFTHSGQNWNPLTDDGDALRLAVRLKILGGYTYDWCQWEEGDPYAATRRAIVRAAAEIGKNKEN